MMTAAPAIAKPAPSTSESVGRCPSTSHHHASDTAMKMPPYAAEARPAKAASPRQHRRKRDDAHDAKQRDGGGPLLATQRRILNFRAYRSSLRARLDGGTGTRRLLVIVGPQSRSADKFLHGIKILMAKNYVDNLGEEVRKGMLEKARQGHWPSVAPIGYVNSPVTRRIEPDPERAPLVAKLFEWYATGEYSLKALTAKAAAASLTNRTSGKLLVRAKIHQLLQIRFTAGTSSGSIACTRDSTSRSSRGAYSKRFKTRSKLRIIRDTPSDIMRLQAS